MSQTDSTITVGALLLFKDFFLRSETEKKNF